MRSASCKCRPWPHVATWGGAIWTQPEVIVGKSTIARNCSSIHIKQRSFHSGNTITLCGAAVVVAFGMPGPPPTQVSCCRIGRTDGNALINAGLPHCRHEPKTNFQMRQSPDVEQSTLFCFAIQNAFLYNHENERGISIGASLSPAGALCWPGGSTSVANAGSWKSRVNAIYFERSELEKIRTPRGRGLGQFLGVFGKTCIYQTTSPAWKELQISHDEPRINHPNST